MITKFNIRMKRLYPFLAVCWVVVGSAVTVFKVAPDHLNADIIMQSIMSLQNVTLYYWGQNRLLNILPLTISFISNPAANLMAALFLAACVLFCLLLVTSKIAVAISGVVEPGIVTLKVFVISSAIFILMFNSFTISEITIGHIEYSLSALLLACGILALFFNRVAVNLTNTIAAFVLFMAVGLNPAVVIPAVFLAAASALYKKKIEATEIAIVLISVIALFIWSFISKQYGGMSYNHFDFEILVSGITQALAGLLSTLNALIFIALLLAVSAWKIVFRHLGVKEKEYNRRAVGYTGYCVVIFSSFWLLFVTSNQWVQMNQFSWRYYIFAIFACIFGVSLWLAVVVATLSRRSSFCLTAIAAAAVVSSCYVMPVSIGNYKIFQRVNEISPAGGILYSGDYWLVWPSVFRDMMLGYEAYGLAYRGESNKEAIQNYIIKEVDSKGGVSVYCLNEKVENCISQINSIIGILSPADVRQKSESVYEISMVKN